MGGRCRLPNIADWDNSRGEHAPPGSTAWQTSQSVEKLSERRGNNLSRRYRRWNGGSLLSFAIDQADNGEDQDRDAERTVNGRQASGTGQRGHHRNADQEHGEDHHRHEPVRMRTGWQNWVQGLASMVILGFGGGDCAGFCSSPSRRVKDTGRGG